jgi:hypothetical protein
MKLRATKRIGYDMLEGRNTHEYPRWHWNTRQTQHRSTKNKMDRLTASSRLSFPQDRTQVSYIYLRSWWWWWRWQSYICNCVLQHFTHTRYKDFFSSEIYFIYPIQRQSCIRPESVSRYSVLVSCPFWGAQPGNVPNTSHTPTWSVTCFRLISTAPEEANP